MEPSPNPSPASASEESKNPLGDVCLYSIGAAAALVATLWFGRALWYGVEARSWPAVPCKITRFDEPFKIKGKYDLRLAYDYTHDGSRYEGHDYRFANNKTRDESVFTRLALGSEAVCYVNPQRPTQAVLDRAITFTDVAYPGFGLLFTGVCGFLTIASVKQLRKPGAAAQA